MELKIGFFTLLGIVFTVLKLTSAIDWEWWVVLSPLWGGAVVWFLLMLLYLFLDG